MTPIAFRFDAPKHEYFIGSEKRPSVTQLLTLAGWQDTTWFTESSRDRGTQVHDLTRDYDLGALDVATLEHEHKGHLLSYVAASNLLKPVHLAIEEPEVHPTFKFGGRPDRISELGKLMTVVEIKSGVKTKAAPIQTALQAILVAWRYLLQPEQFQRIAIYTQPSGKFKVETHEDRRDYDEAFRILREFC